MFAIMCRDSYYTASLETSRPVFLTRPFAYTYSTVEEAKAIADRLLQDGFKVRITKY